MHSIAMPRTLVFSAIACMFIAPVQEFEGQGHGTDEAPKALTVRALANEGFHLQSGDDVLVIDAFVAEPYSGYGALPENVLEDLEGGLGLFSSVDLALVSHFHRDHFQGAPAQKFLAARPDCVLACSPQVIDALWEADTDVGDEISEDAVRAVFPEPREEEGMKVGEIQVEFLRLSHGTGRFASVQNMGHVITMGGVTALHIGDAAMQIENFAPYALSERGIDVAFVPYWYFGDPDGDRIITEHFRPARLIACHIPPDELEGVTSEMAKSHPDVLVPQRALEVTQIQDTNKGKGSR